MAALTTANMLDTGVLPSFVAASTSDTVEIGNGQNTFVVYRNTGVQKIITIIVPGSNVYGQLNPDPALTLLATTGELWIPLRKEYDTGASAPGRATITCDNAATGVTVAVVRHGT